MRTITALTALLLCAGAWAQDFLDLLCANTETPAFLSEDERGFNDICSLRDGENGLQAVRNQFARMIRANRRANNHNQFYFPNSTTRIQLYREWMRGTDWEVIRHPIVVGNCHGADWNRWNVHHNHFEQSLISGGAHNHAPPDRAPYERWWVHSRSERKAWLVELCARVGFGYWVQYPAEIIRWEFNDVPWRSEPVYGPVYGDVPEPMYFVAFYETEGQYLSYSPYRRTLHDERCGGRGCWTVVDCAREYPQPAIQRRACDTEEWKITTGEFDVMDYGLERLDDEDELSILAKNASKPANQIGVKRRIEYFLDWIAP